MRFCRQRPCRRHPISQAEGEQWRRSRLIEVGEIGEAVPGLVRAGRPRSQEVVIPRHPLRPQGRSDREGTLSFTATATRYEVISGIFTMFTDTVGSSGSGQGVTVSIDPVTRGSGLPNSIPPRKSKTIEVEINPKLTSGNIQFDVIDGDIHNGTATITSNKTRTSKGRFEDTQHYIPAEAGTAGRFKATQHYRFKCARCKMTEFRNLLGPISIQRIVEFFDPDGDGDGEWIYRAVKSGVTSTRNL